MTLRDLYNYIGSQLRIKPDAAEAIVCVEVERKGSIGGTPVVLARSTGLGVDWDNGKYIVRTETAIRDVCNERYMSNRQEVNVLKNVRKLVRRKMLNKFLYMKVFGGYEEDAARRCIALGIDPDSTETDGKPQEDQ